MEHIHSLLILVVLSKDKRFFAIILRHIDNDMVILKQFIRILRSLESRSVHNNIRNVNKTKFYVTAKFQNKYSKPDVMSQRRKIQRRKTIFV